MEALPHDFHRFTVNSSASAVTGSVRTGVTTWSAVTMAGKAEPRLDSKNGLVYTIRVWDTIHKYQAVLIIAEGEKKSGRKSCQKTAILGAKTVKNALKTRETGLSGPPDNKLDQKVQIPGENCNVVMGNGRNEYPIALNGDKKPVISDQNLPLWE
jgi:hypothetical protein